MRLPLLLGALLAAAACGPEPKPSRPASVQQPATATSDCAGPRLTTDGIVMPKAIRRVDPDLSACSGSREALSSIVQVTIDASGKVRNFKIVRSSSSCINNAVAAAVRQWTFCPAERDGHPTEATMDLIVNSKDR
jgi:TonB family protein